MASNKHPREYPCYKVVASDGSLCGYSGHGGLAGKEKLLETDGIRLQNGKVDRHYFYIFPSP